MEPLLARAGEFAELAQEVARECRRIAILREQITLLRRDIRKLISAAVDEAAAGDWRGLKTAYVTLVAEMAQVRHVGQLVEFQARLAALKQDVLNALELLEEATKSDANDDDIRW